MAVIKRPPLIVPPDYNLRPPRADDPSASGDAASDAARKTLIGPSSSINGETSNVRAILTGTAPENGTAENGAASDGQNLLVTRSERAERDLDELVETRAENRVDGALLRRLLAWTPGDEASDANGADTGNADGAAIANDAVIVQVVSRSQTVIGAEPVPNPANME